MRECTKLRNEKLTLAKQVKELKVKVAAQGSSAQDKKEESKTASTSKDEVAHLHALQMALQLDESERRQSKSPHV